MDPGAIDAATRLDAAARLGGRRGGRTAGLAGVWRGVAFASALTLGGCFGGGSYTPVRTAFNRGVHLASVGEYQGAIAEYRDALRGDPDDYRARFNLASTLETMADLAEAEGDTRRASELRRSARDQYERLLTRKPGELRASINLALREFADGDREAADRRIDEAVAAYPDDARAVAARSRMQWARGDLEGAERSLRLARDRDPTDAATQMLLGDLLAQRDAFDEAREAYRAILRRDDASVAALRALGALEMKAGEPAAARPWLERVLMLDPDHAEVRLLLADAFDQLGATEAAELQRLIVKTKRAAR